MFTNLVVTSTELWKRGYLLARDIIFYNLSPRMARRLGKAAAGHRYVRVTQDILLIAIGTGMVVDVVYDLNNLWHFEFRIGIGSKNVVTM